MTLLHRNTLFLILAIGGTLAYRFAYLPPEPKKVENDGYRHLFTTQYLAFKEAHDSRLEPWINELVKNLDKHKLTPETAESIATLAGLEGKKEAVARALENQKNLPNGPAIAYAFHLQDSLPDDWEKTLQDDYFGNKLRALIYDRKGESDARAEALFSLRINEADANRDNLGTAFLTFLGMLGLGLMVSMSISSRQFRRMGQRFFNLTPMPVPPALLLRFVAAFLLLDLVLDQGSRFGEQLGLATWHTDLIYVVLQSALGLLLLKHTMFPKVSLLPVLGLENMTMSVGHLFRIIGGMAIIAGAWQFSQNLAVLVNWPVDRLPGMEVFDPIVASPVGTPLYLLIGCILSAAFQEIIFRGLVFRGLLSMMKPWQAIMLSSALYALLHPLPAWPMAFAIGFGLALVFYRTASLMVTIWSHALWSCTFLLFAMLHITI